MPHAIADDGVKLYYEDTGTGVPVIFVHEFAGDLTSWEAQLRHFGHANTVAFLLEQGMEKFAERYAYGPTRVQLENKNPRAFAEFKRSTSALPDGQDPEPNQPSGSGH